ncbi:isochorismatase family protein [Planctomicrobium sp. SH527]|uniref:isochorismatase family protein n=1 Tax=Planctomicrobium sp. SH527 TaxID=3448123 RepID=UPI003F5BD307
MSRQAIVVVDFQNDYFPGGRYALLGIEQASANAVRVVANARGSGGLVIHVRHEFISSDASFFVPGTDGVNIHTSVAPREVEPVILKNFPNSFLKTELKQVLDDNGIEEVVIVGAMIHMCNRYALVVNRVHDANHDGLTSTTSSSVFPSPSSKCKRKRGQGIA